LGPSLVRRAFAADARSILNIEERAFSEVQDRFHLRQVRRLIANPRAHVGVAELEGVAVGWTAALVRKHVRTRSGRLYSVAVAPEWAGRSIGRALLNWSLDALDTAGAGSVSLEVRQSNRAAIALYESVGFRATAKLRGYYGDEDGIRMKLIGRRGS